MARLRRMLAAGLAAAFAAGLVGPAGFAGAETEREIVDQLNRVPGLTVVSDETLAPDYRYFVLSFTQPADHRVPWGATFQQRFTLLHKSTDRPMVLHTTGYWVRTTPFRAEPTLLVDGNQISTEQRFFAPSRPEPANWDHLTIWQAASDHHRLVNALKPIYQRKWIATGTSKGGMTSVYHNRFYPQDVDGVVAYVAPNDTNNDDDSAYTRYFETVGTDPGCRTRLADLQVEAFKRRPAMLARLEQDAAKNGYTFDRVGGTDQVFEYGAWVAMWAFWQGWGESFCPTLPAAAPLTDDVLYDEINRIAPFGEFSDPAAEAYLPYLFQSMTELGWAAPDHAHLRGYLKYPATLTADLGVPPELRRPYRPDAVIDVDRWVRTESQRILFINGEYDAWGAKPFRPSANDSYLYVAPRAMHGTASIATLAGADRNAATSTVRRWADIGTSESGEIPSRTRLDLNEPREVHLF